MATKQRELEIENTHGGNLRKTVGMWDLPKIRTQNNDLILYCFASSQGGSNVQNKHRKKMAK
jgi:hypothetical protein